MEKTHRTAAPNRHAFAALAVACAAWAIGACGSDSDYKNEPRAPSPINITAYVSNKEVSVSPQRFGAGPIVVIVTNQSSRSQDVTFETDELGGSRPGIAQSTGPINPGDTAQIRADVRQGSYRVRVGSRSIEPARVTVGRDRRSAQNQLLQP